MNKWYPHSESQFDLMAQRMLSLPTHFEKNCATVSIETLHEGKRKLMRFFVDSGAQKSILFDARREKLAKSTIGYLRIKNRNNQIEVDSQQFIYYDKSCFSKDFLNYIEKGEIDGILGIDFFESRDILINYKDKKVYVSKPKSKTKSQPSKELDRLNLSKYLSKLPLTRFSDGYKSMIIFSENPLHFVFSIVDTGAGISTVSSVDINVKKRDGSMAGSLLGAEKTYRGWIEQIQVSLPPIQKPMPIAFLVAEDCPALLSPKDLGNQVLFRFQNSEVWF